ncbi:hypothetical protein AB0L85_02255 [Streptomyces sp. NPDC052051]|uniref:hypothetical protein n=1 Tax=Streptomyces sp. NPDC052051 TaxID=3154649 RepID=UPI0034332B21
MAVPPENGPQAAPRDHLFLRILRGSGDPRLSGWAGRGSPERGNEPVSPGVVIDVRGTKPPQVRAAVSGKGRERGLAGTRHFAFPPRTVNSLVPQAP